MKIKELLKKNIKLVGIGIVSLLIALFIYQGHKSNVEMEFKEKFDYCLEECYKEYEDCSVEVANILSDIKYSFENNVSRDIMLKKVITLSQEATRHESMHIPKEYNTERLVELIIDGYGK